MPNIARTGSGDSVEAANFKVALKDAFNVYQSPPPRSPERQPLFINNAVVTLQKSLDPSLAIPRRAEFLLKIPAKVKGSYLRPHKTLVTVMAHPVFSQPMYWATARHLFRVSGSQPGIDSEQHHFFDGDEPALYRGLHGRTQS